MGPDDADVATTGTRPPILIDFERAGQASQRIAGLSQAGRHVERCVVAGFDRIGLALPDGEVLDAEAARDVERLAPPGVISVGRTNELYGLLTDAGAGLLLLDPDWLLPAETLEAFARSGADVLRWRDAVLVHRSTAGNRVAELDAAEPVMLNRPDAARQLLRRCGKPRDGIVSRTINRPVSQRVTGLLLHIPGIRPMHATAGTALLAALMFLALLSSESWALVAGGLLYQAASIFDGVDGEMARVTARTSRLGAATDSIIDTATNLLFVVGITIHAARAGETMAVYAGMIALGLIPIGLTVIGVKTLTSGGPLTFDLLKSGPPAADRAPAMARLRRLAVTVSSRDCYALVFSAMAILDMVDAILFLLATAASIWILVVFLSLSRPGKMADSAVLRPDSACNRPG